MIIIFKVRDGWEDLVRWSTLVIAYSRYVVSVGFIFFFFSSQGGRFGLSFRLSRVVYRRQFFFYLQKGSWKRYQDLEGRGDSFGLSSVQFVLYIFFVGKEFIDYRTSVSVYFRVFRRVWRSVFLFVFVRKEQARLASVVRVGFFVEFVLQVGFSRFGSRFLRYGFLSFGFLQVRELRFRWREGCWVEI